MQIRAGADAIQLFDSWGGIIAGQDYEAASLRWIRQIIAALPQDFPIIVYAKGCAPQFTDLAFSGARVLGIDWTSDLGIVRKLVPANVALQGNLDPVLMNTTPELVSRETGRLLETMRGAPGHIVNLGSRDHAHGKARMHAGAGRYGHPLATVAREKHGMTRRNTSVVRHCRFAIRGFRVIS
ncbi:MAG: uroporphyrinogen decarboxylase family protein [Lacunisphaera sp.]